MRLLLAVSLFALVSHASSALADERIEGIVTATRVTHCDATRRGGCAGTLFLQPTHGNGGALPIQVPLGTPISCGDDRVLLHALQGRVVVVTLAHGGSGAARAIQIAETEPC
ncbi:MAG TPA: hypothetical protein VFR66_16055 [Burkholderiales bacterium]|nr:hypothetical protein [Burkholderiales bacterium]